MKAKHFVILFFVVGLVFAITGLVGPAMAQDQVNRNLERTLQKDIGATPGELSTDKPAEAAAAPQAMPAGGTFFNGTCYSSPLVIPAAGFSSDGYIPDSMFFSFVGGYVTGNSATDGCVKAPAYLPNGATITHLYATVYDNNASYNTWVDLWRVNRITGLTDWMATVETSGASTSIQNLYTTIIDDPLVNYPDYAYYVTSCLLSSTNRLYSARIYFEKQ